MRYDDSLWDNSDPLYAPGLQWSNPKHARWKAPKRYVDGGYPIRGEKLEGQKGDHLEEARAARCRQLTRDMVKWWTSQGTQTTPNTWSWLIARYRTDTYSPYHKVKPGTKVSYDYFMDKLDAAVGKILIGNMNYEMIMATKEAMEKKGRSVDNISKTFNALRRVARYGVVLEHPEAVRIAEILANITFALPPARDIAPSRAQIEAIVAEADRRGLHTYATGLMMQYELSLRAVDVRGQWEPANGREGGVQRNGEIWVDGLTWDMINPDVTRMVKVISKTKRSNPTPYEWDLTLVPALRDRLIAMGERLGPVIVSEKTGMPYTKCSWSQQFRRIRNHLIKNGVDLDPQLSSMDLRAGGLSEARKMGADPYQMRDAGQHASLTMNSRYIRDRSDGANKVVEIRQGARTSR